MKKSLKILFACLVLVALAQAAVTTAAYIGWGSRLACNGATAVLTEFSPAVNYLRLDNRGTADVYCVINSTTNDLSNAVANAAAMIVPASNAAPVVIQCQHTPIFNFWLLATNAAATSSVTATAFYQ